MFSSAFQPDGEIASQPAAITSARAVLPDPRAPMMATRPGLRGMSGVVAQSASSILDVRDDLRRHGRSRRLLADIGAALGIDASLAERIEFEPALDPREAISDGYATSLSLCASLPCRQGFSRRIARAFRPRSRPAGRARTHAAPGCREDHMGELLDLSRTVASAASRTPDVPSRRRRPPRSGCSSSPIRFRG